MSNRTRLLLIGGAVILILVVIVWVIIFTIQNNSSNKYVGQTEKEVAGPQSVAITNTERLNQLLVSKEFSAVKQALNNYILASVDNKATTAKIAVGSTYVNPDNSITFTVEVGGGGKKFDVKIERPQPQTMYFTVPTKHVRQQLNVGGGD